MQIESPPDFSNPVESDIIKLEKLFSKALANGEASATLGELRAKIQILKSGLAEYRRKPIISDANETEIS